MAGGDAITPVASAARTTTGNSGAVALPDKGAQLHVLLNASAASGTAPNMVLSIEWSMDGTNFVPGEAADAFTAITAAGGKIKTFPVRAPFFRFVWTITGTTPSFTFTVSAYVTL